MGRDRSAGWGEQSQLWSRSGAFQLDPSIRTQAWSSVPVLHGHNLSGSVKGRSAGWNHVTENKEMVGSLTSLFRQWAVCQALSFPHLFTC